MKKEKLTNTAAESLSPSQSTVSTASPNQSSSSYGLKRVASSNALFGKPPKKLKTIQPCAPIPDSHVKEITEVENQNPNKKVRLKSNNAIVSYRTTTVFKTVGEKEVFKVPTARPTKRITQKEDNKGSTSTATIDQNVCRP